MRSPGGARRLGDRHGRPRLGGLAALAGGLGGCWRRGRLRAAGRRGRRRGPLDVALHHASGIAGALHAARDRRRSARPPSSRSASRAALPRFGFGARRLRSRSPAAARLGRARSTPAAGLVDDPEHLADLHVVAVLAIDPAQHAGLRAPHLEIDLVGLELDERIAGRRRRPLPCAATWRRGHRRWTRRLRERRCLRACDRDQSPVVQSAVRSVSSVLRQLPTGNCDCRSPFRARQLRVAPGLLGHRAVLRRAGRRRTPG